MTTADGDPQRSLRRKPQDAADDRVLAEVQAAQRLRTRLGENEVVGFDAIHDVVHRHTFFDHDCQTTDCVAGVLWNSSEMTALLADAYERGAAQALANFEDVVDATGQDLFHRTEVRAAIRGGS